MNIKNIKIKNFKSLKNIYLTFGNLTLLTGINSSGKSSIIQSLLLLKSNQNSKKLNLDNEYVQINDIKDLLYEEYLEKDTSFNISLNDNQVVLEVFFSKSKNKDFIVKNENKVNLFNTGFQYLETNRVPPQNMYNMSLEYIRDNLLGTKGEYTSHYLNENKHNRIGIDKLRYKDSITDRLIENVSLWLSEISNGIEISTKIHTEIKKVSLSYSYNYKNKRTKKYTPLNVGFGITYVLPIIVAILKAKKGDLVIIENPESHLHPAGQSKIAELCAIASANGVQIIVETHSDHFLNGIRVATKKALLTPEQSKVYYFRKEKDELETKIDEINIDKNGAIDNYPKGFFDQFDDDLDKLVLW